MATVAGYKAVLLATEHLGKMLRQMMTAAGTIAPANVTPAGWQLRVDAAWEISDASRVD